MDNVNRGIWRHGKIKTFLTRGLFKPIFRPLLYKKEDELHRQFLDVLQQPIIKLDTTQKRLLVAVSWLLSTPKNIFEYLFLEGDDNRAYLYPVRYSNLKNGHLCAHYTQAFVLWNLEQILKNDYEFQQKINLTIKDFEYILEHVYGKKNLTLDYLNQLREEFDLDKMDVDPRDWGIIYVHRIFDLLINDEKIINDVISDWDKDIAEKMSFIVWMNEVFSEEKSLSIDIMNR